MKRSSGPRNTASKPPESDGRHRRLATAIMLAGVGFLAFAWPAEAEIVYTKVHIQIEANSSYNLDLNNDGITDFTISASVKFTGACHVFRNNTSVDETAASGNGAIGSPPAALSLGDEIGPGQTFYGGTGTLRSFSWNLRQCRQSFTGNWTTTSIHYLGLAFEISGETFYGWAELSVDASRSTASAILLGYAYENTSGMSIDAGQTQDGFSALFPDAANPESFYFVASVGNPAEAVSLDALATGAQEVPPLRRKESVATAASRNPTRTPGPRTQTARLRPTPVRFANERSEICT